jgi:hypothetical protein
VRKTFGQHEIATVQTTAIDLGPFVLKISRPSVAKDANRAAALGVMGLLSR